MCAAVLMWSVSMSTFYFYCDEKNILLLISSLYLSVSAQEMDNRGYIVKLGQQAPEFEFKLLSGDTINNDVLKGKVVVLQFTGSWCSVCRRDAPFGRRSLATV